MEVILGSFTLQNFSAIVISSVVSVAVGRIYLGNHPVFPVPVYQVGHFSVLWVYVLFGLLSGLWGFLYIWVLYRIEDWFDFLNWPFWVKAIFAGGVVGLVGIWFPQILGVGHASVDKALANTLPLYLLLALLFLKLLVTSVTIAGGGSGGVFSPGLYQGSMLGGAFGTVIYALFPHAGISPGVLAVVGMAGVFAGSSQAPITAIIMLFELTWDYKIILPLMITSVVAATVTSLLSRHSICTGELVRRGMTIPQNH